jgi:hypothetical protein
MRAVHLGLAVALLAALAGCRKVPWGDPAPAGLRDAGRYA